MGVPAPRAAPAPLKLLRAGPWPGLPAAALGPEGKPHPRAKAFLLFEGTLVPGSHPGCRISLCPACLLREHGSVCVSSCARV